MTLIAVTDPYDPGLYQREPRHYEVDPYPEYPTSGPLPPHQLPYGQPVSASPYSVPPPQVIVVPADNRPSSGLAVASLTFAIIGLVGLCCTLGVPSLFAIIFGHAARADTKRGVKTGHSTATAGMVLGYVGVVPAAVVSILNIAGVKP